MQKILVVDDDVDILEAMQLMLEQAGYDVTTTPKGEEVNKKIKQVRPDMILLDVLLSGNDGRDICRQLKSQQETKNIPVVMISAHPDAKKTTKDAGADEFLAKPFEIDELLEKVKSQLK